MSHSLNAALVGYGFAGKTFHAPFLSTTPGLSLGWVVSRDAAKVQADLPGADVLVVVDDSKSMSEEQDLLRRGFAQTMAEFRDSVGQRRSIS